MRRVEKYKRIQLLLRMDGLTNTDVGEHLGRSKDYTARRFRLQDGSSFGIEEAYAILDLAGLPREDIFKYFPPGGKDAPVAVSCDKGVI